MATNTNGLIYYKLDASTHGYEGDVTKNCGLRGEEIDGNFNFLRGHDIKSISFDEKGCLYLTRYDGVILTAKQAETPNYDFSYNQETGTLTIVTPDGKEIVLDGFKITTNIYADYTINGNGLQDNPLSISNLAKPGRYLPAIKLINTIETNDNGTFDTLPIENNAKHDRYVTKEKISRFGKLFPLSGVKKITERLNSINSEWHVPTKAEWDEILNEIDCANPDHDSKDSNVELGEFAGTVLKSTKYWEPSADGKIYADDAYGFSIYPVGYCGNRGIKYYGSFGLATAFWTATVEDNHNDMYVKTFNNNYETVGQNTWGDNYYLSLRLVKKFTGNNFNATEDIDGFSSNCVLIPGTTLIWTKENVGFSQEEYGGFTPKEWDEFENDPTNDNSYDIRYFVNDWNGNGWDKQEIKEGESIVLYESENGRMHEFMLVDGEFRDTFVYVKNETIQEINRLEDILNNEINNRIDVDNHLWIAINTEVENRTLEDAKLSEAINEESNRAQNAENQLLEAINEESNRAQNIEGQLFEAINDEIKRATETEAQIIEKLNEEINVRQETDKQIFESITHETENRENADIALQRQINENKLIAINNSVVIVDGKTNENHITTQTTIKVNLDDTCNHIKLDENGIYFDGYFGQF